MKPAKLFSAIVVAGAALTACGDDDDRSTDTIADAGTVDAGDAVDAGMSDDAGSEEDAFVAIL